MESFLQIPVDKARGRWYYNQAVSERQTASAPAKREEGAWEGPRKKGLTRVIGRGKINRLSTRETGAGSEKEIKKVLDKRVLSMIE